MKTAWLGTIGLGQDLGGVAHVARSCVSAMETSRRVRLARVASLMDSKALPASKAPMLSTKSYPCHNRRTLFASRMAMQSVCRPDIVVYDHLDIAQVQTVLPKQFRSPFALWIHGIEAWNKGLPSRKVRTLKLANRLIFNSEFTRERFQSIHGPCNSAVVIPLVAPNDTETPIVNLQREPWILTVGRIEKGRPKGHDEILAVLPNILRNRPETRWHIVGKGSGLSDLKSKVSASGCSDHIHMHGFISKASLSDLFSRSRVFCMPSQGEGFGIVYLESMSFGCVPIGSTSDAAREVIGGGGICVDLAKPQELQRELLKVLSAEADEYQRLSRLAFERSSEFNVSDFQTRFIDAISSLPINDS